jgi:hypothetical protein
MDSNPEQHAAPIGKVGCGKEKNGSETLMVRTRRNIVTCGGGITDRTGAGAIRLVQAEIFQSM